MGLIVHKYESRIKLGQVSFGNIFRITFEVRSIASKQENQKLKNRVGFRGDQGQCGKVTHLKYQKEILSECQKCCMISNF